MLVARCKACSLSVLRTWVQVPRCSSVYFIRMYVYVYFQTIFLIPVPSIHLLFTSNKTNTGGTPTLIWTQHQQLSQAHRWDTGLTTLTDRETERAQVQMNCSTDQQQLCTTANLALIWSEVTIDMRLVLLGGACPSPLMLLLLLLLLLLVASKSLESPSGSSVAKPILQAPWMTATLKTKWLMLGPSR